MADDQKADLRRFRWLVFGGIAALLVVATAIGVIGGGDEEPEDKRLNAELACQRFIADAVDPLDVDFREVGSARVDLNDQTYRVRDRMVVRGALEDFDCRVRLDDGGWRLIRLYTP